MYKTRLVLFHCYATDVKLISDRANEWHQKESKLMKERQKEDDKLLKEIKADARREKIAQTK